MVSFAVIIPLFVTATFIYVELLLCLTGSKNTIAARLGNLSENNDRQENDEFNKSLFIRAVKPIIDDVSRVIIKITPKEILSGFEKKAAMAGYPYNLKGKDWLNAQAAFVVMLPIITIFIATMREVQTRKIVFLIITEVACSIVFPLLILNKKIRVRQSEIEKSLPDVIDLLTVSVEAGLGFDGALAKVIEKFPGQLSMEFLRVQQEIKVGKQKRDALRDMVDRVGVADLTTFITSIIQADQFGVAIGNVLRIQSEQMRMKRRQRAQEKAMKAPVKMLIPMVLFIFPTIFSVLIGPVAIKMVKVFFN